MRVSSPRAPPTLTPTHPDPPRKSDTILATKEGGPGPSETPQGPRGPRPSHPKPLRCGRVRGPQRLGPPLLHQRHLSQSGDTPYPLPLDSQTSPHRRRPRTSSRRVTDTVFPEPPSLNGGTSPGSRGTRCPSSPRSESGRGLNGKDKTSKTSRGSRRRALVEHGLPSAPARPLGSSSQRDAPRGGGHLPTLTPVLQSTPQTSRG